MASLVCTCVMVVREQGYIEDKRAVRAGEEKIWTRSTLIELVQFIRPMTQQGQLGVKTAQSTWNSSVVVGG